MGHSSDHERWLLLGSVWLVTLFLFILFQCVSPLLPVLIVEFHLDHWMGGFLYTLPVLMVALFSYPLGLVSDRVGLDVALGCGAVLAVLSSLIRAFTTSYPMLGVSTAIFGLGLATCFINLPRLVKMNFPPHLTGTATGVYTSAIPLGCGLGIALTKPLLDATGGWRAVIMTWSLMAIPVVILWWVVAPRIRRARGRPDFMTLQGRPDLEATPQQLEQNSSRGTKHCQNRAKEENDEGQTVVGHTKKIYPPGRLVFLIMICGLLFSLLNFMFYSTMGWLPTYLIEKGWDAAAAGSTTSVISFAEIPAILLTPVLSDRTGRRRLIMVVGFFLISICSGSLAFNAASAWVVTPVLGATFGGIFALLLAMPVVLVGKDRVASAAGAIISIGYVGALAGPIITGYLRDITTGFGMGFLLVAMTGLVSVALSCALPPAPTFTPVKQTTSTVR